MIKEQFTAFCLSLLPWLGPLVYRDGVNPPLNPGRPSERAGESTRTPLISPEKLALPRVPLFPFESSTGYRLWPKGGSRISGLQVP